LRKLRPPLPPQKVIVKRTNTKSWPNTSICFPFRMLLRTQPNIGAMPRLISQMLERRGVKTRLLEVPEAPPVVFGEILTPGATRTLTFYVHYDGQPVEPAKWVGGEPFKPILRSASLDAGGRDIPFPAKAKSSTPNGGCTRARPATTRRRSLQSARRWMRSRQTKLRINANLKFFFEGEEEAGSPHLEKIAEKYRDLLKADAWLICDGPVDQTRRQQQVLLRRARSDRIRGYVLRPAPRITQRPLRQLGAEPCADAVSKLLWLR
jgi:hypothetical protein